LIVGYNYSARCQNYNQTSSAIQQKYLVKGDYVFENDTVVSTGLQKGNINFKLNFIEFKPIGSVFYIKALLTDNDGVPIEHAQFLRAQKDTKGNYLIKQRLGYSTKKGFAKFKVDLNRSYLIVYYPSYTLKIYGAN